MKLFLSSTSVPGLLKEEFCKLVGKQPDNIRIALFENAADPYHKERHGFVEKNYEELRAAGFSIDRFDLRTFIGKTETIITELSPYDAIWFGGGNTFYLRWLMRESGFETVVRDLLGSEKVYAGGSAGAIVAGPILNHFDAADDPNDAPSIIWEGLGLVDIIPLPHWNTPKFQGVLNGIRDNLLPYGKELVPITDEQAIIVDVDRWRVSP